VAAGVAELSGEVLAVALERDPLGEVAVLAQDQILAAHLAVVHLVAQPGVEALRMGLPRLVELQGDMGVHAEGEVVVDDVRGLRGAKGVVPRVGAAAIAAGIRGKVGQV